jgi:hypothetical protein
MTKPESSPSADKLKLAKWAIGGLLFLLISVEVTTCENQRARRKECYDAEAGDFFHYNQKIADLCNRLFPDPE